MPKLTKNLLDRLIREEMEKMNIATKNDIKKHRDELQKDREERRKREKEIGIMPDGMKQLSKGIVTEDIYEEDEEGYVRIPKSVLDRHLNRTKEDIALWAKQMGYKTVEEWLKISNALASAQKGSLFKNK
jgi:hypothetical protein